MKIEQYCVGQVQTNCYFAINEKTQEMVVIDPGDFAQLLAEKIKQKGLKPKAVLLTHGHFDHAMAAQELAGIFGVKIYAHEAEKETLEQSGLNASGMIGRRDSYQADVFVKDGQVLQLAGMDLKVLHTPGHTEGGCCFYSEEEKVLFSGDTLFCQSVGRTDFPRGSMSQLIRSIRDKLLPLPDDVKVYPGHMGVTTIGMERRGNPFIS
ncbi:MAG: MBL fold metallo-hydrolase [Lachnospiraceae bacterium]|nr:MBL fold metallo-hydrolase [Lachnospiraceae bacterium]